jgi:uridylate kinase
MFANQNAPIIISVGGSLIVPDKIDTNFLQKMNTFVRRYVGQGRQFFLITGGGKTCRNYQQAAQEVNPAMLDVDLDWLGTHVTRLNGHLLRTIFVDIAHPRVIENYEHKLENWKEPVVIGAGWKPGFSSDYDAVLLARDYGGKLLINLSNIDWIYDKDPRKFPDAKPLKHLTWKEYTGMVGTKWTPGMNTPFDPKASELASQLGLKVIVTNGSNFQNLTNIIEGKEFTGTVIEP